MSPRWQLVAVVLLALVLIAVISLALLAWWSRRLQPELGLRDGRLLRCVDSGTCVCSEDGDIDALHFDGDAAAAWRTLLAVLEARPGVRIQVRGDDYLHATAHSALFGFVDDLECRLDAQRGVIHLRSASRVGGSDLGANRARIEALRAAFAER